MIENIIRNIPVEKINTKVFVSFYIYGTNSNIENFLFFIKNEITEFHYEELESGIRIDEICNLNQDDLERRHKFYTEASEEFSLDYDGFEVQLENDEFGRVDPIHDFHPDFKPGDLFSYKTESGKYIIGIYYGGRYKDIGCLFNFYDGFFDTEKVSAHDLENKEFLYRNPVLLMIDSAKVKKLDLNNYDECSCFFRIEVGEQSIDYFEEHYYSKDNNQQKDYIDILHSMYEKGEVLYVENWMFMEYVIKNNKVTARDLPSGKGIESSYHFGAFGNIEMVESRIKRENKDIIFLSDEVLR